MPSSCQARPAAARSAIWQRASGSLWFHALAWAHGSDGSCQREPTSVQLWLITNAPLPPKPPAVQLLAGGHDTELTYSPMVRPRIWIASPQVPFTWLTTNAWSYPEESS